MTEPAKVFISGGDWDSPPSSKCWELFIDDVFIARTTDAWTSKLYESIAERLNQASALATASDESGPSDYAHEVDGRMVLPSCGICGSLMMDRPTHDRWHGSLVTSEPEHPF